jgi:hypothetical protein
MDLIGSRGKRARPGGRGANERRAQKRKEASLAKEKASATTENSIALDVPQERISPRSEEKPELELVQAPEGKVHDWDQGGPPSVHIPESEDIFSRRIRCDLQGRARTQWELSRETAIAPVIWLPPVSATGHGLYGTRLPLPDKIVTIAPEPFPKCPPNLKEAVAGKHWRELFREGETVAGRVF